MSEAKYDYSQKRSDYLTPPALINNLLKEIGRTYFDLDVCCSVKNIPALYYATEKGVTTFDKQLDARLEFSDLDGLKCNWGRVNWMNPPFKTCRAWVQKAFKEQKEGKTTYSILPVRTENNFWHDILKNENCEVRWMKKGLCFYDPDTMQPVQMKKCVDKVNKIYESVDGIYQSALAVVIFHGIKEESYPPVERFKFIDKDGRY